MDFLEIINNELKELNKGNEDIKKDIQYLIKFYNKYNLDKIKLTFNGFDSKDRYIITAVTE